MKIATTVLCLSACSLVSLSAKDDESLNKHWNLLGDFVYMRRSEISKEPLVKNAHRPPKCNGCPNFTVLTTKKLVNEFDFEPGYRLGLAYMDNPKMSVEGIFLYLQPWRADKSVHGDRSLYFPFKNDQRIGNYSQASDAKADYRCRFWDLEFNYWRHFTPRRIDYFSVSGIVGLRYFHWNEGFKLTFIKPPDKSYYHIRTKNDVFGLQTGLNLQINPMRWLSWDFTAKAGVMADSAEQRSFMGDGNNTAVLRDSDRQKGQIGFFADVLAQIGIQFKDELNLHGGYEMIYLTGIALAPEQIDKSTSSSAGEFVNTHGSGIIHGLFVGLTFSF